MSGDCDSDCAVTFAVPEEPVIVVPCNIDEDQFTIPEDEKFVRGADYNVFRRPGN